MKLRETVLVSFEDEYGTMGLVIDECKRNGPDDLSSSTEGRLMAHDIVEHINGPRGIGDIDDELEALGAVWFTRGHFGDISRGQMYGYQSPEDTVASDVTRLFEQMFNEGKYLSSNLKRTRPVDNDDGLMGVLEAVKEKGLRDIDHESRDEARLALPGFLRIAKNHMRTGYRKAQRKYGTMRRANDLFWTVCEAVTGPCRNADNGREFALTWGFKDGNAFAECRERYDEDFY